MSFRNFFSSAPVFFFVILIQEGLETQMRLPLGSFNLFLIVALIWAALSTPEIGALTGFATGLALDLSQTSTAPMGQWTLVMIIACYGIAFLGYGDDNIRANPVNIVFLTTIGVVLAHVVFVILGLLLGEEYGSSQSIFWLLVGSGFWTAIVSPLILKIVAFIHSRIFGVSSKL
jgi:rod shape-determining protein MreD